MNRPTLSNSLLIGFAQCCLLILVLFTADNLLPSQPDQWLAVSVFDWPSFKQQNSWMLTWIIAAGGFFLLANNQRNNISCLTYSIAYGGIVAALTYFQPHLLSARALVTLSCYALFCILTNYYRSQSTAIDYSLLFKTVWNTAAALILTAFFMALAGLVLLLWAALFESIHITWFAKLFSSLLFSCFALPILFAIGLHTVQSLGNICEQLQHLLLSFCRLLLPLLALIGLLYVVTSIIHWADNDAGSFSFLQSILPGIALLGIIFINACYQDTRQTIHAVYTYSILVLSCSMVLLLARDLYERSFDLHNLSWQGIDQQIGLISLIAVLTLGLLYYLCYLVSRREAIARINISLAWLAIAFSIVLALLPKPAAIEVTPRATPPQKSTAHDISEANLRWVDAKQLLNTEPVLMGYNHDDELYVCRAIIKQSEQMGLLKNGQCTIVLDQQTYPAAVFEILAGDNNISWQSSVFSHPTDNGFPIAAELTSYDKASFVCRAIYQNRIHIGSYTTRQGCWIADGTVPVKVEHYTILFATPNK